MKVLQVIAEMGSGGAEAVVEELSMGLSKQGWEISLASGGGRRLSTTREHLTDNFEIPLARRSLMGLLRTQRALSHAARVSDPDVLHAHNVGATLAAHLGARHLRRRPPMLATFHGVGASDYTNAARILSRCADLVVVVSEAIGERLIAAGLRRRAIHVVPNAVRPLQRHDAGLIRAELGLSPRVPIVLCLARLEPQKRHDLLLSAWSRVSPESHLLLAGAGTLRAQLEVEVERLGLADRVRLLGERSDPDRLLSVADVVVLSSDWEGMPISLLEAMSIGVPIVATDVDGVSAAVGSEAALLVPPGDHERLAQALTSALTDNELRARMGRAGLQRSARKFSADAMVSSYSNLYKGLLSPISSSTRWAP